MPWASDHHARAQLTEVLQSLPGLEVSVQRDQSINVGWAGHTTTFLTEVKKAVFPRDARLLAWYGRHDREAAKLLVAETISPGAKDFLRENAIGYFDSGGSLFLSAAGLYILIDKPPPKPLAKMVRSVFSGRRSQVLHALFDQSGKWVQGIDLARRAEVSPATASQVLKELERFDWVDVQGDGPSKERRLHRPGALLDAWASHVETQKFSLKRYFVPGGRDRVLENKIAETFDRAGVNYAMTHEAAAQRYSPHLTTIAQARFRVTPGLELDQAIAALDAREVGTGANLALIEAGDPGELLFRRNMDGVWLASPVQVYLDLIGGGGRAKEMAAHLRQDQAVFNEQA